MKIVIDDEKIIDLLETEWGYEGIREDVTRVIRENGTPLDGVLQEIRQEISEEYSFATDEYFEGLQFARDIIDKHIKEYTE